MLEDRAHDALERARRIADRYTELAAISQALELAETRLHQPMRVAVAGRIKRGKSTLVNAMLGDELVATGREELTYNVIELCHGPALHLAVHYRNGHPSEGRPLDELAQLSSWSREHLDELAAIRSLEVTLPNAILRRFRLVDTPGLDSVFDVDSANAIAKLGLDPESVTRASTDAVDSADAVVYLFSRALSANDVEVVREFGAPVLSHMSPIKAIGVLSRADAYWPPRPDSEWWEHRYNYDPLDRARPIVERYLRETPAGDLFYDVLPVVAKLAVGAATLTETELGYVEALGQLPAEVLFRRLRDEQLFATEDFPDIPLDCAARRALLSRLGNYGVYAAGALLRDGARGDEFRAALVTRSGVAALRDVVTEHFGNRALLIKLTGVLRDVLNARRVAQAGAVDAAAPLREIGHIIGQLASTEHGFRELDVLREHYQVRADRPAGRPGPMLSRAEEEELLTVTGEHGTSCAARLGCVEGTPVTTLLDVATGRLDHWKTRALDPSLNRALTPLLEFFTDTYQLLIYHLAEARKHLAFDI